MSSITTIFKLQAAAKKTGGDKYVCESDEKFVIYIPQTISRDSGEVKEKLVLKIGEFANDGSKFIFVFDLVAEAKKTGGDKYACKHDDKFVIYLPQTITRAEGAVRKETMIQFIT